MLVVEVRRSVVAVGYALEFGARSVRVMALRVLFPDIGSPSVLGVGFLRYSGESILGEAESVGAVSASNHNL